jgi:hypothetical protein
MPFTASNTPNPLNLNTRHMPGYSLLSVPPPTRAPRRYHTPLDATQIKQLKQVIGIFLFYARVVDPTMLVALGTLAAAQSHGIEATADTLTRLLNYAATHPDAQIRYTASDMTLYVHSNASYLSVAKARSRVEGKFLSECETQRSQQACLHPRNHPPMAQYTLSVTFSRMSCHRPRKRNLPDYFTTQKMAP